eukprot:6868863-Pyramimonas_sp.AAC.1
MAGVQGVRQEPSVVCMCVQHQGEDHAAGDHRTECRRGQVAGGGREAERADMQSHLEAQVGE